MKRVCKLISDYMGVLVLLAAVAAMVWPEVFSRVKPTVINPLLVKDDFNPYKTDEVFTDMEQLQRIKGDVYLVCFDNKNPGWFLECDYEQVYGFHFMYYNFSLYRIYNF